MDKILIVEDDAVAQAVLERILSESGEFSSVIAENGIKALAALEQHDDVKAILLDRNMPDMNGMETIKKIQEHPEWKDIPVIFQTAADEEDEVIEGALAGAYYYLTKPYNPALVLSIVRSALDEADAA